MGRNPPHLLHVFPSYAIGGVPVRIATVINGLGPALRHTILALDGRFEAADRIDPVIRVDRSRPAVDGPLPMRLATITRALEQLRPDLLLTFNWGAIEWALANGISRQAPHLHFESGFGMEEAQRRLRRRDLFRRIVLTHADGVVVPSDGLVEIARRHWAVPPEKLLHLPNGIATDRYCAVDGDPDLARRLRLTPGVRVVGTVAPLRPEKNIGRLLRVFAALPDADRLRLLIVGDGAERPGLEALCRLLRIDDRTVFAGSLDAVERALPLMDLFVITSDTEQMPNALLQAMAAGLPVASVDVGDVAAMLVVPGQVAPRGDDRALTGLVASLLADPERRSSLGQANRRRVLEHYHLDRMLDAYRTLFGRFVSMGEPAS